jgi:hypothetical protein
MDRYREVANMNPRSAISLEYSRGYLRSYWHEYVGKYWHSHRQEIIPAIGCVVVVAGIWLTVWLA